MKLNYFLALGVLLTLSCFKQVSSAQDKAYSPEEKSRIKELFASIDKSKERNYNSVINTMMKLIHEDLLFQFDYGLISLLAKSVSWTINDINEGRGMREIAEAFASPFLGKFMGHGHWTTIKQVLPKVFSAVFSKDTKLNYSDKDKQLLNRLITEIIDAAKKFHKRYNPDRFLFSILKGLENMANSFRARPLKPNGLLNKPSNQIANNYIGEDSDNPFRNIPNLLKPLEDIVKPIVEQNDDINNNFLNLLNPRIKVEKMDTAQAPLLNKNVENTISSKKMKPITYKLRQEKKTDTDNNPSSTGSNMPTSTMKNKQSTDSNKPKQNNKNDKKAAIFRKFIQYDTINKSPENNEFPEQDRTIAEDIMVPKTKIKHFSKNGPLTTYAHMVTEEPLIDEKKPFRMSIDDIKDGRRRWAHKMGHGRHRGGHNRYKYKHRSSQHRYKYKPYHRYPSVEHKHTRRHKKLYRVHKPRPFCATSILGNTNLDWLNNNKNINSNTAQNTQIDSGSSPLVSDYDQNTQILGSFEAPIKSEMIIPSFKFPPSKVDSGFAPLVSDYDQNIQILGSFEAPIKSEIIIPSSKFPPPKIDSGFSSLVSDYDRNTQILGSFEAPIKSEMIIPSFKFPPSKVDSGFAPLVSDYDQNIQILGSFEAPIKSEMIIPSSKFPPPKIDSGFSPLVSDSDRSTQILGSIEPPIKFEMFVPPPKFPPHEKNKNKNVNSNLNNNKNSALNKISRKYDGSNKQIPFRLDENDFLFKNQEPILLHSYLRNLQKSESDNKNRNINKNDNKNLQSHSKLTLQRKNLLQPKENVALDKCSNKKARKNLQPNIALGKHVNKGIDNGYQGLPAASVNKNLDNTLNNSPFGSRKNNNDDDENRSKNIPTLPKIQPKLHESNRNSKDNDKNPTKNTSHLLNIPPRLLNLKAIVPTDNLNSNANKNANKNMLKTRKAVAPSKYYNDVNKNTNNNFNNRPFGSQTNNNDDKNRSKNIPIVPKIKPKLHKSRGNSKDNDKEPIKNKSDLLKLLPLLLNLNAIDPADNLNKNANKNMLQIRKAVVPSKYYNDVNKNTNNSPFGSQTDNNDDKNRSKNIPSLSNIQPQLHESRRNSQDNDKKPIKNKLESFHLLPPLLNLKEIYPTDNLNSNVNKNANKNILKTRKAVVSSECNNDVSTKNPNNLNNSPFGSRKNSNDDDENSTKNIPIVPKIKPKLHKSRGNSNDNDKEPIKNKSDLLKLPPLLLNLNATDPADNLNTNANKNGNKNILKTRKAVVSSECNNGVTKNPINLNNSPFGSRKNNNDDDENRSKNIPTLPKIKPKLHESSKNSKDNDKIPTKNTSHLLNIPPRLLNLKEIVPTDNLNSNANKNANKNMLKTRNAVTSSECNNDVTKNPNNLNNSPFGSRKNNNDDDENRSKNIPTPPKLKPKLHESSRNSKDNDKIPNKNTSHLLNIPSRLLNLKEKVPTDNLNSNANKNANKNMLKTRMAVTSSECINDVTKNPNNLNNSPFGSRKNNNDDDENRSKNIPTLPKIKPKLHESSTNSKDNDKIPTKNTSYLLNIPPRLHNLKAKVPTNNLNSNANKNANKNMLKTRKAVAPSKCNNDITKRPNNNLNSSPFGSLRNNHETDKIPFKNISPLSKILFVDLPKSRRTIIPTENLNSNATKNMLQTKKNPNNNLNNSPFGSRRKNNETDKIPSKNISPLSKIVLVDLPKSRRPIIPTENLNSNANKNMRQTKMNPNNNLNNSPFGSRRNTKKNDKNISKSTPQSKDVVATTCANDIEEDPKTVANIFKDMPARRNENVNFNKNANHGLLKVKSTKHYKSNFDKKSKLLEFPSDVERSLQIPVSYNKGSTRIIIIQPQIETDEKLPHLLMDFIRKSTSTNPVLNTDNDFNIKQQVISKAVRRHDTVPLNELKNKSLRRKAIEPENTNKTTKSIILKSIGSSKLYISTTARKSSVLKPTNNTKFTTQIKSLTPAQVANQTKLLPSSITYISELYNSTPYHSIESAVTSASARKSTKITTKMPVVIRKHIKKNETSHVTNQEHPTKSTTSSNVKDTKENLATSKNRKSADPSNIGSSKVRLGNAIHTKGNLGKFITIKSADQANTKGSSKAGLDNDNVHTKENLSTEIKNPGTIVSSEDGLGNIVYHRRLAYPKILVIQENEEENVDKLQKLLSTFLANYKENKYSNQNVNVNSNKNKVMTTLRL